MTKQAYITKELFKFFKELRKNNSREWFQANKPRYETDVRKPLLQFITDFEVYLRKISRHYVADPRPVGGSLFRIHRDVRFSKDKSPYKTHAGVQFRHKNGKDVHAPGFYLHLEPGTVFAGVGIWHPDTATLNKVRDAIVGNPKGWMRSVSDSAFCDNYHLEGESLMRPPKGYDPDFPLIEDLKRKDFVAVAYLGEKEACSPDFIEHYAEMCRSATPFMKFLTKAVGLTW